MHTRRLALAGVTVLTTLSLSLTGCGSSDDSSSSNSGSGGNAPASASPTPKEPKTVLAEAAQKSGKDAFHYTMKYSVLDMVGDFDPAKKTALVKTTMTAGSQTIKYDTIMSGTDAWLKYYNVQGLPKKWLHIGADQLGADNKLFKTVEDPTGATAYSSAAVDLQQVDETHLKGTVDLSKTAGSGALQQNALEAMGDAAKAVPIEVVLDDQGRMSTITLSMPAIQQQPAAPMEITFSDYGKPVEIKTPAAAETQEAPESVLKGFR